MVVRRRAAAEEHFGEPRTQLLIGIQSMTKSGAPRLARTSAVGQLGAVFLLAFGVFVACGNDTPEFPAGGNGGASGKTSAAGKAGKGGDGAEAGEEAASGSAGVDPGGGGDAGSSETGGTGGTSGAGGRGGSSSGTAGKGGTAGVSGASSAGGGTGGKGATCGNGTLDPGEACDDGNTKFGDSCSPTCTNLCETCETNVCGTNEELVSCDGEIGLSDTAATGPATGVKKSVLCKNLLGCLKRTGCAQYEPSAVLSKCYCGTASPSECAEAGKPNGPCVEEVAAAGEDRATSKLVLRQLSPQYALGVAAQVYGYCDGGVCANECVAGKQQTTCQKCSASVGFEAMAACYTNPKADPLLSAPLCSAIMECAHRTRCALNGVGSCYGVVTNSVVTSQGPCFAELTAAGGNLTPQQMITVLVNPEATGTISSAATELAQEATFCAESCFPASSGGAGGAGSGGHGGGGSGGI